MNPLRIMVPAGLLLLGLLIYAATFVVYQWETALKLRLGEIVETDYEPGLHFMVPVLNSVNKFDRRIQTLDSQPERFLTIEKKDVIVDSYTKWRIADVAQYFRSTGGNPAKTGRLLSERINTSLRDEFGKLRLQESDFAFAALLDQVRSIVQAAAQAKGLSVTLDNGDRPDWVRGDATRLRQALLNG